MTLSTSPFLFIDCQTTGMRPSVGSLLEMAWGWGSASQETLSSLQSELVQLPEGQEIPKAVQDLTGIQNWNLAQALTPADLLKDFLQTFPREEKKIFAIIHYAQFETPFLRDLFLTHLEKTDLPFEIICSQKMARRLFPQLPSRNIRGLAGYFGTPVGDLKRASSHVQSTFLIWQKLVPELESRGISTVEQLTEWLKQTPKAPAKVRYEYRIEKDTRLKLPSSPGIYKMKAKSGDILYVGKATSLKSRVNSYFRGKKGRDRKKLEMLAQVWDLEVVQTETALEAALLENDEIKRLDPPYNISLKAKDRSLRFFSRDFSSPSLTPSETHPMGPFRPQGAIDQLKVLEKSLQEGFFYPLFFEPIPASLQQAGFDLFCAQKNLRPETFSSFRSMLAFGACFFRQKKKLEKSQSLSRETDEEEILDEEPLEIEREKELTPEDLAVKFEKLFCRVGKSLLRARQLTRLLNAEISWESEIGWKSLQFRNGRMTLENSRRPSHPWQDLGISDYDRMSILWNEISKRPHRILSKDRNF